MGAITQAMAKACADARRRDPHRMRRSREVLVEKGRAVGVRAPTAGETLRAGPVVVQPQPEAAVRRSWWTRAALPADFRRADRATSAAARAPSA